MSDFARKIAIHIRHPKKKEDSHAHKRAKAHLHAHDHDAHKAALKTAHTAHDEPKPSSPSVPLAPESSITAVTFAPPKFVIPKKPSTVEGISMSALQVAYLSMEIGLRADMPTYAGGLGVLAGDMLLSCADLGVPAIGVTLLYRKGYFHQHLDDSGWQHEEEETWDPAHCLTPLPHEVHVMIEERDVRVRAWLYKLRGVQGNQNPVIFLDTDIEGNSDEDRRITDRLYDGDARHRLIQEVVLGIAGLRMLAKLGAANIQKFHMNEGHAALLTIELYRISPPSDEPIKDVRRRCVFTTHTPVAAGHDHFPVTLVESVLGKDYVPEVIRTLVFEHGDLNMTRLGFGFSHYINGVARKHGEVTRELFPGYQIESITNGVYAPRWVAEPFAHLFDKYLPSWRTDSYSLRYALAIPGEELWSTHEETKRTLLNFVNEKYQAGMDQQVFTIGFARRAAAYKRGELLFADIERLKHIALQGKGIQIIYSGKAHPADNEGKLLIQRVIADMRNINVQIKCVYIENYDIDIAKLLVSGVDLWLNTPTRPQEASGTSGMKAALNGVPQFSVLDGWWIEGHIENVTGWSMGPHPEHGNMRNPDPEDIEDLYAKLEHVIIPRFEHDRAEWIKMMRSAIAINGSFFNSHRMAEQYVLGAYFK
jgi:starch phosphorylase